MLLPDPVVPTLQHLTRDQRAAFLTDLSLLGDVILAATGAEHVNYLILCNQVPELHGHVVPRFASEEPGARNKDPFEAYDFGGARVADAVGEDRALFERLQTELQRVQST